MTQEARRSMVWLEWIEIRQFRGVKPGTRLEFNPGFNVLLGRNGTGKTTLLELCAAVLSGDFSKFEDEEFDVSARIALGDERFELSIRTSIRQRELPEAIQAAGRMQTSWRFSAKYSGAIVWSVEATPEQAVASAAEAAATIAVVSPFGPHLYRSFVFGVFLSDLTPGIGDLGSWLLGGPNVMRMDEALDVYSRFLGGRTQAPEIRVVVNEVADGQTTRLGNFYPDTPAISLAQSEPASSLKTFESQDSPWAANYAEWLGAEKATLRLHRTSSSSHGGGISVTFERPELEVRFSERLTVTHERLSFGQKRLFAFIYLVALSEGAPLIADELVNGLHYSWIQNCIDYLREPEQRQAILASQSPLLVDHLEFDDAEDTRRTFILCSAEDDAFQWRQMTESEADEFFGAYEIGIEHVGEILRNRGLW